MKSLQDRREGILLYLIAGLETRGQKMPKTENFYQALIFAG